MKLFQFDKLVAGYLEKLLGVGVTGAERTVTILALHCCHAAMHRKMVNGGGWPNPLKDDPEDLGCEL